MRNKIAFLIQQLSSSSRGIPTNETVTTESQQYVSSGIEEMPSHNMPVQRLNVVVLLLALECFELVTNSGEILTTGKSDKDNPVGLFPKDD
jgi:hypothetical protein